MAAARTTLWILWAALFAALALYAALPHLLPPPAIPWYDAQTAVVGFVLALLSLAAAVGGFALREAMALRHVRSGALDPATPAGFGRLRALLFVLWSLADLVGLFGVVVAWGAANPRLVWPYLIGAAALFVLHAPRDWLFTRPAGGAAPGA